ncbi:MULTISPECIES: methionine ABC transporter permease [unclassified Pseudoclavibacter]|uniref:methionine ABC transporter permease n=1 Tax=unclassified Pseudoclavibacter TaxID=2615177 RepID=UPI0013012C5C|nr:MULTISPECIES: methionine ABC transporter permease [unclassified Pseudoclavibacter]KAB1644483.1 ABC transporter permease [Pseudoclavibacter sp. CFCC 14310]KAB1664013.1 ABC transporter permease [Pseudoclavibacter sp. CFCC 13611]
MGGKWETLWPVLLQSLQETIYMVVVTLVISGVAGLIIGAVLYATRPGNLFENRVIFTVLNFIINIVRPIPFIIFLTAVGPLTKLVVGTTLGTEAAIVPMVIMAAVVIGRVVEQNLVAVDPGLVEAARALGAPRTRILFGIVIPEALAPLILGYTFMFIAVVDMSAMAGYIGGGGLGNFAILYGYQQFNQQATWVTVAVIVVIVQIGQLLGNWLAQRVLRR